MKKIIDALNSSKLVSAWKIIKEEVKSCELFYVLNKLENNRATDIITYYATIYRDQDDMRGSSTITIYPYMDEEMIREKIKEGAESAILALNPFYEIPSPEKTNVSKIKSNLADKPFIEVIEEVKNAVFKASHFKNGYLSATEFFLYETEREIVNSKGVDVKSKTYKGNVELIPSWEEGDEEVEIYHMMEFSTVNEEQITKDVEGVLELAKARFEAKKYNGPSNINVIIENEEVCQVVNEFASDLSYGAKYMHSNVFELGDLVQGDDVKGDKLSVDLVPTYENAINSATVDDDGVVLKPITIIKDGFAVNNHGSFRYGYYLKVKEPTGLLPVMVVAPGKVSISEMKKKPYVRCVKLSGLQVDLNSGYFGGEVRLGFYFDGEKEIPVTGFSISGDLKKEAAGLTLSKEEVTLPSYHGPKYMLVKGMTIA